MQSYTPKYIELESKYNFFRTHTWGIAEKPLWLSNCIYRDTSASRERDGVVMMTRGAIYIFRNKFFKGYKLRQHHHLLKFSKIEQLPGRVLLRYKRVQKMFAVRENAKAKSDEVPLCIDETVVVEKNDEKKEESILSLEMDNSAEFCVLLELLVKNILYENDIFPMPEFSFSQEIERFNVDKRPKYSLQRRAIFMAHMELDWGNKIIISRYFRTKWNGGNVLRIGRSFQPNYYATAFGEAVGWETAIDTVCFRTSTFKESAQFLNGILKESINVRKIVFADYEAANKFDFSFSSDPTRVDTWHFVNCCSKTVSDFLYASDRMSDPPKEVAIARRAYNAKDIGSILEALSGVMLETLQFVDLRFRKFPFDGFSFLVGEMTKLSTLVLRNINTDGNKLFASVTKVMENAPVFKHLKLQKLSFKDELPADFKLPETVESIDISESEFIGKSLHSFLCSITKTAPKKTFALKASHLKVTEYEFQFMKNIDDIELEELFKPSICEFELSSCFLPSVCIEQIFRFLECQKSLKQLTLMGIECDAPDQFSFLVNELFDTINLTGLDINLRLSVSNATSIINRAKHCNTLQRLCMTNTNAGNECLSTFIDFIENAEHLHVFACDGCSPSALSGDKKGNKHPLITLWQKVADMIDGKSIIACDFPYKDINALGYTLDTLPDLSTNWVKKLTSPDLLHTSDTEKIKEVVSKLVPDDDYDFDVEDEDDNFSEVSDE